MRLGAHISIRKGFEGMAREAEKLGLEAVQVFTRSPRGGKAKEIDEREVEAAQERLERAHVRPLVIHTPYLVNLGAKDPEKRSYGVSVTALDMARADLLGATIVVVHVGRHDGSEAEGLGYVAESLDRVLDSHDGKATLCLENTAGQGRELGYRFREMGEILRRARRGGEVGVCLDTCHAFAAGYDISNAQGWEDLLEEFRQEVGLERLLCVHCNDSTHEPGSRKDRHSHIGEGHIGLEGFRVMLHRPELKGLPCILETPVKSMEEYSKDLNVLRSLRQA